MDFKDLWDLESAMKVISHETVDGKLWAEAAKWLILHGPVEIRKILLEASTVATDASFPELVPGSYTADGQACYDVRDLAKSLSISEKEVWEALNRNESHVLDMFFLNNHGKRTIH